MSTSAQTDIANPEVFGIRLAVGSVSAERLPDGKIRVRDLPIFSEIRPTDPGAEIGAREPRDKPWLDRALEKHRARRVLGQKPAMTLRHIFDGPERVGEYELTHVDLAEVNPGELPRWTLFGDKVYESMQAFEKSKIYDFRSAEISPDAPDELAALALLRDKMPFHKYPNVVEQLAPETVQAFEAFRSKGGTAPQVWKGRVETFGNSYEAHATTKEGAMPGAADEKNKAPSLEERMEAMMAKFEERMMSKFEERFGKAAGVDKKPGEDKPGEKKPEASEAKSEAKPEEKKPEAAEARGPNDILPPAVSELRVGEVFSASAMAALLAKNSGKNGSSAPAPVSQPEVFSSRMAAIETANLGLKAQVEAMQREKNAVVLVASARKILSDMGVAQIPEAFEQALSAAAIKGGKPACDELIEHVKLAMGLQGRAPETFGASAQFGPSLGSGQPDDLKKAVETFGARPEMKSKIHDFYSAYREMPEHFRRSTPFLDVCAGHPEINPNCMEARGGLQRKA